MAEMLTLKKQYDGLGMYEKIVGFPEQLKEGWEIGRKADLPKMDIKRIQNIIVCGLGGSGIGGDVV